MYSIFAGGNIVYDDVIQDMNLKVVSPKLVLEDSSPGSLEFDLPPTNDVYDTITRYKDRIAVRRRDSFIWYGRISGDTYGINGMRHIYCEGALAILNDTIQPRQKYNTTGSKATVLENYLSGVISAHNSRVGPLKQFKFGGVRIGSQQNATSYAVANVDRWTCYENTLEVFSNIHDETGWHIYVDFSSEEDKYVIYLMDDAAIAIEGDLKHVDYRKNLVDISVEYDISTMASVVLPLGSSEQGNADGDPEIPLTIPANYLDDDPQRKMRVYEGNRYFIYDSRIWCMVPVEGMPDGWEIVSGDDVFESKISIETNDIANDADKYETLVRAGILFLHEHRPETASYTIQAVDGYYAGIDMSHVNLYDHVNVTYPILKNGKAELKVLSGVPVMALEIPLDSPGSTIYTLNRLPGDKISDMTSLSTRNDIGGMQTSVDGLRSELGTAEEAISTAGGLIFAISGDVSTLKTDVNSLKGRATSLENDVSSLKGRATSLENDVSSLKGRATSLETRATNLETRATNLESTLLYAKNDNPSWTYISAHGFYWHESNTTDYSVYVTINLPKTVPSGLTITVQTLKFYLRSSAGNIVQTNGYDALANSTVEVQATWGDTMRLKCTKNSPWTLYSGSNIPDNSVVDGMVGLKLKFT